MITNRECYVWNQEQGCGMVQWDRRDSSSKARLAECVWIEKDGAGEDRVQAVERNRGRCMGRRIGAQPSIWEERRGKVYPGPSSLVRKRESLSLSLQIMIAKKRRMRGTFCLWHLEVILSHLFPPFLEGGGVITRQSSPDSD